MTPPQCALNECDRPRHSRGLCQADYARWRRGRLPQYDAPPSNPHRFGHPPDKANPWEEYAPACPRCGATTYLFTPDPERWICPPCLRIWDGLQRVA